MLKTTTVDLDSETEYIKTYNTFMVYFHRSTGLPMLSLVIKILFPSIHCDRDTAIFTDII